MKDAATNIKNLPDGEYYSCRGYSDVTPYVVESKSPSGKTLRLRQVLVRPDPDWTPEMHVGGFAAHCSNQADQTWLYGGVDESGPKIEVRLGTKSAERVWLRGARYYYDYNF